jgi:hypothetical protein
MPGKIYFVNANVKADLKEETTQKFQQVLEYAAAIGFKIQYFATPEWGGVILTKE